MLKIFDKINKYFQLPRTFEKFRQNFRTVLEYLNHVRFRVGYVRVLRIQSTVLYPVLNFYLT